MKKGIWDVEEIHLLRKYLVDGKGYKEISELLQRDYESCQSKAKKLKIRCTHHWARKSTNDSFWSIPNSLNCYWAGFAATDGCVSYRVGKQRVKETYSFSIGLGIKDHNHVERFKQDTQTEAAISIITNKKNVTFSKISVHSNQWGHDLNNNFNVTPRKTFTLQPPNLTDDALILSFIIGAIDGDGCIRLDKSKGQNNVSIPEVLFTSGAKDFIEWIFEHLVFYFPQTLVGLSPSVYKDNDKRYTFAITGIRAACVIDYLRRYSCPKLDRKWNNPEILERIEEYRKCHPNFFDFSHLPAPI